jgi:hypoxanthine-DNA glycosylase
MVVRVQGGLPVIESKKPIARPDARVLVLGSIPSEASLAAGQYYGHPRNAFWYLMQALFAQGEPRIEPANLLDYARREHMLMDARVALWDVFQTAERPNSSLDSAIVLDSAVPNPIPEFLLAHPQIHSVLFNGTTAESFFGRFIMQRIEEHPQLVTRELRYTRLPSTSPANASVSFAGKLEAWHAVARAAGV